MIELTEEQQERQQEYRSFVDDQIIPVADRMDSEERTPPDVVAALAAKGYFGVLVPPEFGGTATDMMSYGLLCHEMGRGSSSLLSLLTVHGMVCTALLKWGTDEQRKHWLPRLAKGEPLGAFALSEPNVGSDARSVETTAQIVGDSLCINGRKKWISYAQMAGLVLVVGQSEGNPTAFLVEKGTAGLECLPIGGMLGFRAAMLGELLFTDCHIPATNVVGRMGFGFSHVVGSALDCGRYSVAWGCTGLAQECLDLCMDYGQKRTQGGSEIRAHQLIQRMVADMITDISASRALCIRAAALRDKGEPESVMETSIAKYFASRTAVRVSNDAVQVHGANGCGPDFAVQRHFRDARIMEIIEGSTQIQQIIIARSGYHGHIRERRRARSRSQS